MPWLVLACCHHCCCAGSGVREFAEVSADDAHGDNGARYDGGGGGGGILIILNITFESFPYFRFNIQTRKFSHI